MGADGLERGSAVRVKLGQADLMTLDISGTVVERLDRSAPTDANDEDPEEEMSTSAVTLAIDLQDDPSETTTGEPSAS
jgi:hypothetical protein